MSNSNEAMVELADQITKTARTSPMLDMLKGIHAGLSELLMRKGDSPAEVPEDLEGAPKPAPGEGEGEEEEEEEEVDGEGEGNDPADGGGYKDMMLGEEGDEVLLDVEPMLHEVRSYLRHSPDPKKLRSAITRMAKATEENNVLLRDVLSQQRRAAQAQASTLMPLAKGINSIYESIAAIPNTAPALRQPAGRFAGDRENPPGVPVGVDIDQVMSKGLSRGLLSERDVSAFRRHGHFRADPAENAALIGQLLAQ